MAGYVSPFPTTNGARIFNPATGEYRPQRQHLIHGKGCNPAMCRECWREQNWERGQTHG